jgi:hypothetical protein
LQDTIAVLCTNFDLRVNEYHLVPIGIQYTETPAYLPTNDHLNSREIGNWSKYFSTRAIQNAVFWTNQQLQGKENAKRSLPMKRSKKPEVVDDDEFALLHAQLEKAH